jgi:replicative DNA helicase
VTKRWDEDIVSYDDTPAEVAPEVIQCAVEGPPEGTGTAFGLPKLDRKLRGIRRNDFIVLAAPANTGKTPFLLDGMRRRGLHYGMGHQMFFTFEMQKEDVLRELVSQETGIPLDIMLSGANANDQAEVGSRVEEAILNVNKHFSILDGNIGKITFEFIRDMILHKREQLAKDGKVLDLVGIDYLQLLADEDNREITKWTRNLKMFCNKERIPVCVISSLNNKYDDRVEAAMNPRYKKPGSSLPRYVVGAYGDLRGSGNVQYDASKILFMLHDYDDGVVTIPNRWIQIKKNKFGLAGGISEVHINRCLKFEEGHR